MVGLVSTGLRTQTYFRLSLVPPKTSASRKYSTSPHGSPVVFPRVKSSPGRSEYRMISHVQKRTCVHWISVMCPYSLAKFTSLIRVPLYLKRSNSCNKIVSTWISGMKSIGNHSPNITVSPRSSLMDRKVKICISGLEAGQPITLHASVVGDANEIFESHAHYVADREGKIFISLCL